MKRLRTAGMILATNLLWLLCMSRTWAIIYTVVGLGACNPVAINEAGQVVGDMNGQAFIWDSKNGMRDLGTLGGMQSQATAINNHGQVVGWATRADGWPQAFCWIDSNGNDLSDPGEMINLGTFPTATDLSSFAYGINDAGWIIGEAEESSGNRGWVRWFNGQIERVRGWLGNEWVAPTAPSWPTAVNGVGQIVGVCLDPCFQMACMFQFAAFRWQNNVFEVLPLPDLAGPTAINEAGQVIGTGIRNGAAIGWFWHNGELKDLGHLGGGDTQARGLSDAGTVVGSSRTSDGSEHAFVWDGTMRGNDWLFRGFTLGR